MRAHRTEWVVEGVRVVFEQHLKLLPCVSSRHRAKRWVDSERPRCLFVLLDGPPSGEELESPLRLLVHYLFHLPSVNIYFLVPWLQLIRRIVFMPLLEVSCKLGFHDYH